MGNKDNAKIGRIDSTEIKVNRDGDRPVRLMKTELTDPEDLQTVEQFTQPGIDSNPPKDSLVQTISNGNAWKTSVGINDKIDKASDLNPGEIEVYSSDPDSARNDKQATIRLKNNKDIIHDAKDINSNADENVINTIGNDKTENVGNNKTVIVGNDHDLSAGNNIIGFSTKAYSLTSGTSFSISAGTTLAIAAVVGATITAASIALAAGVATVVLAGGLVSISSGSKSGVSFPSLKSGFDSLVSTFNSHTHSDPQGGSTGPPSPTSSATVDAAESSGLKVP